MLARHGAALQRSAHAFASSRPLCSRPCHAPACPWRSRLRVGYARLGAFRTPAPSSHPDQFPAPTRRRRRPHAVVTPAKKVSRTPPNQTQDASRRRARNRRKTPPDCAGAGLVTLYAALPAAAYDDGWARSACGRQFRTVVVRLRNYVYSTLTKRYRHDLFDFPRLGRQRGLRDTLGPHR